MADGSLREFKSSLKTFWDHQISDKPNVILVVAGSVSGWIGKNILDDPGFYGRESKVLNLKALPLDVCSKFWGAYDVSAAEKFKILAVTGGVPRYLEEIIPTRDSTSNILDLCFKEEGFLFREYPMIFTNIFGRKSETYEKIVETLIETDGLTADELKRKIGTKSGNINNYLKDLVKSGFLSKVIHWSPTQPRKASKITNYKVVDNYLRFYLSYIKNREHRIREGIYILDSLDSLENWDTMLGIQFENLVLENKELVFSALSLTNTNTIEMASSYFQKKTASRKGCQIDLLIQTINSLYVCEIKLQKKIRRSVEDDVKRKIAALKTSKIPKHLNIFPVLIFSGSLTQNLKKSDYFIKKIDFADFLTKLS